ncbi:MAG: hypothetical protein HRT87_09505 [Legionellales bacterium]|nr:hypothetical protein [Legionellales bacterium]
MKKIVLLLAVFVAVSCSKEEDLPEPTPTTQSSSCNCGTVVSDDVSDYSIRVRNSCSNNIKKFNLEQSDWMVAYVGSNICMSTNW